MTFREDFIYGQQACHVVKIQNVESDMVAPIHNPNTWKIEEGRFLQVQGHIVSSRLTWSTA